MESGQRALAYIRVSVVGNRAQRNRFESPDLQRDAINEWCRQRGVTITGEIRDLNRSGGTLTRPGLTEARERLANGEADGIVVARSDRASRNVIQGLSLIDELEAGGHWIAATDGTIDSTTPEGRMVTTIILASSEREIARFKAQSAVIHKRAVIEKGRHMGPAPFGYRRDGDGRLIPDPDRAPWVVRVFEMRAENFGWIRIARELENVRQANGRRINQHMLRRMVRRRVYLGEASHGEHVLPGAHPELVSESLFAAANRAVTTVASSTAPRVFEESVLRGLLRCAGCRYAMKRLPQRSARLFRWRCRSVLPERSATHDCVAPASLSGREAADVERIVVSRFFDLAAGVVAERQEHAADREVLERRLGEAEALLDELSSLEFRRELGAARWSALVREARADVESVTEALARARVAERSVGVADRATVEEAWEGMTTGERQDALRSVIQAVMITCDGGLADRVHVIPVWEPVELPRRGAEFVPVVWCP